MLAITESTNPYMDHVFREAAERAERIARERDERDGPYMAEIVPGQSPRWHLVAVHPSHEGVAAAHLSARRFGVYVPELADVLVTPAGKVARRRVKMFPGYVFVWCWSIEDHRRRIEACPGVSRIVRREDGGPAVVVPDDAVEHIQSIEETSIIQHELAPGRAGKPKKRRNWRKKRAAPVNHEDEGPITISTKSYWTGLENLDEAGRVGALNQALSLP